MKPSLFRILIFILPLVFSSGCISTKNVKRGRVLEKMITENVVLSQNFTGVVLYDLENDKTIMNLNGERYFTPASNTKLLTYYTTSQVLKDSVSAMEYMEVGDSLIFWGTGDPTFLHPDFSFQPAFEYLKSSTKQLFFYPKYYKDEYFGSGWAWDDYQSAYSLERSAFPIYGNRARFTYFDSLSKLKVYPEFFRQNVTTTQDTLKYSRAISRLEEANAFTFLNNASFDFEIDSPVKYSHSLFTSLLSDTLKKEVRKIAALPNEKKKVINGYPVDSLFIPMLQDSDNFLAEQLIIMASNLVFDSLSSSEMIQYVEEHWLADLPDKPRWVDGSGLSRYNLVTPRSMVKLLSKMYLENAEEKLFEILPAGGESGTLENWYAGDSPYVFAKSGSLSNNYSLSGYLITKSKKRLIFSFMTNHYLRSTSEIKKEIETMLKYIHENY